MLLQMLRNWGLMGLGDWVVWGIATFPKRGVVQLRDYLNTALSKCGGVVVLALALSLV